MVSPLPLSDVASFAFLFWLGDFSFSWNRKKTNNTITIQNHHKVCKIANKEVCKQAAPVGQEVYIQRNSLRAAADHGSEDKHSNSASQNETGHFLTSKALSCRRREQNSHLFCGSWCSSWPQLLREWICLRAYSEKTSENWKASGFFSSLLPGLKI